MASAADLGEAATPAGGPHVRDKQDVGVRLALAFRDNFVDGDGPFYTPGAVAASARPANANASVVAVSFANLPPGAAPLLPATSALGLEVSADANASTAAWLNASWALVEGASVHVGSALQHVRQVRYLWSDNACLGWDSATATRETDPRYRCPLRTSGEHGLPVLPFVLAVAAP